MAQHDDTHHVNYLYIFFILCVFTVLSAMADMFKSELKALLAVVVLSISTAKALCVMGYFMHLKFEGNWKYLILAPTIILALGIPMALLSDIGLHYYLQDNPQKHTVVTETEHHGEGGESPEAPETKK